MDNEIKSGAAVMPYGCKPDASAAGEIFADVVARAVEEIKTNAVYDAVSAAAGLHRSPRWVAKMCAAGRIHAVKNNGWRILGRDLIAFFQGK